MRRLTANGMTRIPLFILTLMFAARVAASQQAAHARPDFSGAWVLDTARSDHSPLTPSAMEITIQRSGDTLHVTTHVVRPTGETTTTGVFDLAGRPTRNVITVAGAETVQTATTSWSGDSLQVKTVAELQGQALTQTATWAIAPGGTTLDYAVAADIGGQHIATRMTLARRAGSQ